MGNLFSSSDDEYEAEANRRLWQQQQENETRRVQQEQEAKLRAAQLHAEQQRMAEENARQAELRRQEIQWQETAARLERERKERELLRLKEEAEQRHQLEQLELEKQRQRALHFEEISRIEARRNETRALNEAIKEVVKKDLSSSDFAVNVKIGDSMIRGDQINAEELQGILNLCLQLEESKQLALTDN